MSCCRIGLGLRDPRDHEPRKQVEEEGKIRSPGKAGATDRPCCIQGGTCIVPCAEPLDASRRPRIDWCAQEVEHAGHRRAIISRNPPLIDEDGYSIDSDDDEDRVRDAATAAAEADPYSSIRLERAWPPSTHLIKPKGNLANFYPLELLAPLTSVSDLANHPALSRPFRSTALNELANQACDLMHKENRALWKVRPLLTRLSGDLTWVTPEMMLGPNDKDLFRKTYSPRTLKRKRSPAGDAHGMVAPNVNGGKTTQPSVNGETSLATDEGISSREKLGSDVPMTDSNGNIHGASTDEVREGTRIVNGEQSPQNMQRDHRSVEKDAALTAKEITAEGAGPAETNGNYAAPISVKQKGKQPETRQGLEDDDVVMVDGSAHPHHNGGRGVSPEGALLGESFIHPIFLAPKSTHPDRDLGLPEQEAEDIRRLLQMYVQKQEEVCRGTQKLYQGLLQADRLRKTVLEWSKAEAHVGELSDGEDWYDKEEWRLTEDLKKGQDEDEEEATQPQKKTRNRK